MSQHPQNETAWIHISRALRPLVSKLCSLVRIFTCAHVCLHTHICLQSITLNLQSQLRNIRRLWQGSGCPSLGGCSAFFLSRKTALNPPRLGKPLPCHSLLMFLTEKKLSKASNGEEGYKGIAPHDKIGQGPEQGLPQSCSQECGQAPHHASLLPLGCPEQMAAQHLHAVHVSR